LIIQAAIKPEGRLKDMSEATKKIDVIIPAYKAHGTMFRVLSSIAIQTVVRSLSVTIVNDADGSDYSEFVGAFSKHMDVREIKLEKNGGPGVARQFGIDSTSLPYFTCIDADDTFASAYSLELLLNSLERDPAYHTAIGTFAEEQLGMKFVNHPNDMIWMFGKLYTRSFIRKYNIRFNETRANEDNGFNTMLRLCASETEKIMFLPDVVYYWHYKEDSITRVNNGEYSYNQSFPGYTENMIYAVREARKVKPFNSYIDMWAIQVMAQLYLYYMQTVKRDPRFVDQNFSWCARYYRETYAEVARRIPLESINAIFAETMSDQAPNLKDIVPGETIHQFIDRLSKEGEEK